MLPMVSWRRSQKRKEVYRRRKIALLLFILAMKIAKEKWCHSSSGHDSAWQWILCRLFWYWCSMFESLASSFNWWLPFSAQLSGKFLHSTCVLILMHWCEDVNIRSFRILPNRSQIFWNCSLNATGTARNLAREPIYVFQQHSDHAVNNERQDQVRCQTCCKHGRLDICRQRKREGERERERERRMDGWIYIYIYIWQRPRQARERERERDWTWFWIQSDRGTYCFELVSQD